MWLFIENNKDGAFLYAIICGFVIGAVYDLFRISRAIYAGSKTKMFFEDVLFCIIAAVAFAVFSFNACFGVVRMFAALGALLGFFTFRFTLGLLTVPVAKTVKALIRPYLIRIKVIILKFASGVFGRLYTKARVKSAGSILKSVL